MDNFKSRITDKVITVKFMYRDRVVSEVTLNTETDEILECINYDDNMFYNPAAGCEDLESVYYAFEERLFDSGRPDLKELLPPNCINDMWLQLEYLKGKSIIDDNWILFPNYDLTWKDIKKEKGFSYEQF